MLCSWLHSLLASLALWPSLWASVQTEIVLNACGFHAGSSGHNHGPESVGLSCLGHVRDCRKVATCQCPQRERHPRICWKNWTFSVAQEVKMALALQSSNILYLKRPKTSKLNGKACLSQVAEKMLLAWSEVKHVVQVQGPWTMEMHLPKAH